MLFRSRDRIDREYAQPLDVEALARGVHVSAGHLSRQFKLAYGESPYSYLMTRRIERAMALLRRGGLSVTEVCFAVGCSSLGTFSTRFTELVGVPPSTYRRRAAGATAGMPSCVAKQVTSSPVVAQHLRELVRLRRVRDRIDREYAQPLDVEALARGAHMSAGHLSREFRLAYGESPYAYLMTRRIERAMALLRGGDLSVTEVCFAVGCSSLGTFSSRFTELVGVPPSTYRREAARATAGLPPCVAKQVTRPVRNREARVVEPHPA